jgi:Na+/H+ antiporter NhaD/arsenite permease-like protein
MVLWVTWKKFKVKKLTFALKNMFYFVSFVLTSLFVLMVSRLSDSLEQSFNGNEQETNFKKNWRDLICFYLFLLVLVALLFFFSHYSCDTSSTAAFSHFYKTTVETFHF